MTAKYDIFKKINESILWVEAVEDIVTLKKRLTGLASTGTDDYRVWDSTQQKFIDPMDDSPGGSPMNTVARLGCFFLLAILAAGSALAQSAAPAAPANGQIVLDVVVSPKSGAAEGGLQQQDFKVLDNGKPQAITSFQALKGRNASVEVVVVLDSVNTEIQTVEYARSELEKFLRAEGGRLAFPLSIAVVTDTDVQMLGDFSADGNALATQLNKDSPGLRAIRRSAGLQGAAERWELSLTALRKLAAAEAARPGRKIEIWLSPGWPLLARASGEFDSKEQQQVFTELVKVSNDLAQARVTLYMIDPRGASQPLVSADYYKSFLKPVTKSSQVDLANLGLQVFAIQGGGLVFTSDNDIAKALQTCLADAAPYYEISFVPSSAGGGNEYHRLEVNVDKPGLTARTRQGYYSRP